MRHRRRLRRGGRRQRGCRRRFRRRCRRGHGHGRARRHRTLETMHGLRRMHHGPRLRLRRHWRHDRLRRRHRHKRRRGSHRRRERQHRRRPLGLRNVPMRQHPIRTGQHTGLHDESKRRRQIDAPSLRHAGIGGDRRHLTGPRVVRLTRSAIRPPHGRRPSRQRVSGSAPLSSRRWSRPYAPHRAGPTTSP